MEASFPGIRKMGQGRSRVPVWVCDPRELWAARQGGRWTQEPGTQKRDLGWSCGPETREVWPHL